MINPEVITLILIASHIGILVGGSMLADVIRDAVELLRSNHRESKQTTNPFRKE